MVSLIIQARLASTRLPQKALLPLNNNPMIVEVMKNAKKIRADNYVLACDKDSFKYFEPLAKSCGYLCISGPKDNVLERFCVVVRKTGAKTVVRVTGDNPFIFTDAANEQIEQYKQLNKENYIDYFTYLGLPHGSGVEIFSATSLLEAAVFSDSFYEKEHVGPALLNHPERFVCIKEKAPAKWFFPNIRTTIDTKDDYNRSIKMIEYLKYNAIKHPFSSNDVLEAWRFVEKIILFIPSSKKGRGTGHISRVCKIVKELKNKWRCLIYLPSNYNLPYKIPESIKKNIIDEKPQKAHLVVIDNFRTSKLKLKKIRQIGPVLALDEGGFGRKKCDFLLDIIPRAFKSFEKPNIYNPNYLDLPENRKKTIPQKIKTVLVIAGGENSKKLAQPYAQILAKMDFETTLIEPSQKNIEKHKDGYTISGPISNLKEQLCFYDLVVTHFGFTAFEALAANSNVILFSPSWYHYILSIKTGFTVIAPISNPHIVLPNIIQKNKIKKSKIINLQEPFFSLSKKIENLSSGQSRECPLCRSKKITKAVYRDENRTIVKCKKCLLLYQNFQAETQKQYSNDYFFEEYEQQYGKTYLQDFEHIKSLGKERFNTIKKLLNISIKKISNKEKTILDIGCAFGPFLLAAKEAGWQAFGTDVNKEATEYVKKILKIPAYQASFPALDDKMMLSKQKYAAITMWFVIEHLEDLEASFNQVKNLLIPGGIFAFSTPSASGVSAITKKRSFFSQSPSDHISIFHLRTVKKQLKNLGFNVKKIKSTGHHPNRFPFCNNLKPNGFIWKTLLFISKLFYLGDTFEIYALKHGTLEDIE